jgi:hypothetical protein
MDVSCGKEYPLEKMRGLAFPVVTADLWVMMVLFGFAVALLPR